MFDRSALAVTCALLLGSCSGSTDEIPHSNEAAPLVEFDDIVPPEVLEGWPCPPFLSFDTTFDKTDDDDGDNILDCQEEFLGSDPNSADSDGDLVDDFLERGNLTASLDDDPEGGDGVLDEGEGLDTDRDGILDISDIDDDGDGIPTAEEDSPIDGFGNGNGDLLDDDFDNDGTRNYLDVDNEGDFVWEVVEDMYAGNNNGDPRDDDFDGDGIPNYVDTDDDGDGADGCEDSGDRRVDGTTFIVNRGTPEEAEHFNDDADLDGIMNFMDLDDDGDGILTEDEDWDGSGNACDDDLDGDLDPDFRDTDDDGDTVLSLLEDLDGNGSVANDDTDGDSIPNFRDRDDDGDGTNSFDERPRNGGLDARDTDRDGIPDYLDDDDDNDGFSSLEESTDESTASDSRNPDDDGDKCPSVLEPSTRLDDSVHPVDCEYYTLTIEGLADATLKDAYEDVRAFFILRDASDAVLGVSSVVVEKITDVDDSSLVTFEFETDFPLALEVDEAHTLDYFLDVDGDGSCGAEPSFRQTVTAPTSDEADFLVTINLLDNGDAKSCAEFP